MIQESMRHLRSSLAAYFSENNSPMSVDDFIKTEIVLYTLFSFAPENDPYDAYLLYSRHELIGCESPSPQDYYLSMLNRKFPSFRGKKRWSDALDTYRSSLLAGQRAFVIFPDEKSGGFRLKADFAASCVSFREREQAWLDALEAAPPNRSSGLPPACGEVFYYYRRVPGTATDGRRENEYLTFTVDLKKILSPRAAESPENKDSEAEGPAKAREEICLTWDELLDIARDFKEKCPADYSLDVLRRLNLLQVSGGKAQKAERLKISQVVNMLGMVGTGKSTLIRLVAEGCRRHGKKVVIVTDTVYEIFKLHQFFSERGIKSSPLSGRKERLKYINQLHEEGTVCLPPEFSRYLTGSCLLDAWNAETDEGIQEAIPYGEEPCFGLKLIESNDKTNQSETYRCPFYESCSATRMYRDCLEAPIIITSTAGFVQTRIGINGERFLEYVLRSADLVIFDESDRCQKSLDQMMLPQANFDEFMKESGPELFRFTRNITDARQNSPARANYLGNVGACINIELCLNESILSVQQFKNSFLREGRPFSALSLLNDLKLRYELSETLFQQLYNLAGLTDSYNIDSDLQNAMMDSCVFGARGPGQYEKHYASWKEKMQRYFPASETLPPRKAAELDEWIKLILRLAYFDYNLRVLNSSFDEAYGITGEAHELLRFSQNRFLVQQQYMPRAVCGNIFGFLIGEQNELLLFKQYGFGRSLLKDLPYLLLNKEAEPCGPHVMLLSGSSWAEGSLENHINRPVSYILEATPEIRGFIKKISFFELKSSSRISGSRDEKRREALKNVIREISPCILQELERDAGKLLLVVNSYKEAVSAAEVLRASLREQGRDEKVIRLVSDKTADEEEDVLQRGQVKDFARAEGNILIAPALAIERGHNIVDDEGHTALGALFFITRPMPVPHDLRRMTCTLNGMVEAECRRQKDESPVDFNKRVRRYALAQWHEMLQYQAGGISSLSPAERRNITASLFVLILQIFGRLARVTDTEKEAPHVYFADGAFRAPDTRPESYDCLKDLHAYLKELIEDPETGHTASSLYGAFFEAFNGGIEHV